VIDSSALVAALKKQVLVLEDDLRTRLGILTEVDAQWRAEYRQALEAERTAGSWVEWRDDRITQVAVAWVLTCVFIRFCEDNALLRSVWISGPGVRHQEALDAQLDFFRRHPDDTDREWLLEAIRYLGRLPATQALVDEHSALRLVSPSGRAVTALLDFWRRRDEAGRLMVDFTDRELSTRFLGDLYQDLSEHAKKTYALLQTPEFVVEFILDQTMEPALGERPLEGFRLIDPACGSGHFLLGAFRRLLERWDRHAPSYELQHRVQLALDAIHGVDINPFAVAIARFRLTVAALKVCGLTSLEQAPALSYHLATGDSLLFGSPQEILPIEGADYDQLLSRMAYRTEDLDQLKKILQSGRYDVVVGNPPYITVKDKKLNVRYRELYPTCKGTYALTVPFMERLFDMARQQRGDQPAGWVAQITSNSFMKREFGSKLIEKFLVRQDLRLVVDTSGAYIPGHGTPTAIIVGRSQVPIGPTVRVVSGLRGEPGRPENARNGVVWSSIVKAVGTALYEDAWISVADMARERLSGHPWNIGGRDAAALEGLIRRDATPLATVVATIGYSGQTNADGAFLGNHRSLQRRGVEREVLRRFVAGEDVRDYCISDGAWSIFPYNSTGLIDIQTFPGAFRLLWPSRTITWARATFSKQTYRTEGRTWWEWHQIALSRSFRAFSIAYPNVATHNHFALDRAQRLFNPHAPFIQLPEQASENDHVGLLGVLNSSVACFWLKQNSHGKGNGGVNEGFRGDDWEEFWEFTGTTLQDYPLPPKLPSDRARQLDQLAQHLSAHSPAQIIQGAVPTADLLHRARCAYEEIRGRMIAQQEELDWEVYGLYGLPRGDLVHNGDDLPTLNLGERAFEIALARSVAAGEEETAWFNRHGSTPITEIPAHWPAPYHELVQRRLDLIESDPNIRLLEKPEHKRRWAVEPWEKQQEAALRSWLLDRLEDNRLWFSQGRPMPRSISQLADEVARDRDLTSVLAVWEGRRDVAIVQSLTKLMTDEAVPFLAAYRLKDSGLRKFEAWRETWALQRREDVGEQIGPIPVPPKYTSADFRKAAWWQARGKLDVAKERFILYPDAGRSTDPTLLLGWGGWDHAQQALALATIIGEREAEGWEDEDLIPLVAGLAELQPWVEQWHADIDPAYGISLAAFSREQLAERARQVNKSLDELADWRPQPTRGRMARR
jgi:hypothetical protein